MSVTDTGRVRPIEWVQAVRQWLLETDPTYEQLQLPGMPLTPPPGASFRAFLGWIWTYADARDGTGIRAKVDTVAQVTDTHPETTKRHFREAREAGWLVLTARHNNRRPNEYALAIPPALGGPEASYDELSTAPVGAPETSYECDRAKSQEVSTEVVGSLSGGRRKSETRRRKSQETPISRSVDQNNIRAAGHVHALTPEQLHQELLLSIPRDAQPELTHRIRRNLEDAIAKGHTAQTIREEYLADLPSSFGPGLVNHLLELASIRHPQIDVIADNVLAAIAPTAMQKGLPE